MHDYNAFSIYTFKRNSQCSVYLKCHCSPWSKTSHILYSHRNNILKHLHTEGYWHHCCNLPIHRDFPVLFWLPAWQQYAANDFRITQMFNMSECTVTFELFAVKCWHVNVRFPWIMDCAKLNAVFFLDTRHRWGPFSNSIQ